MKIINVIVECILLYMAMVGCVAIGELMMDITLVRENISDMLVEGFFYSIPGVYLLYWRYKRSLIEVIP